MNVICNKMALYDLFANLPLTGRLGLSQEVLASNKSWSSRMEARLLTGRPGSYRGAGPLTVRLGLSKGGWDSHREVGALLVKPDL